MAINEKLEQIKLDVEKYREMSIQLLAKQRDIRLKYNKENIGIYTEYQKTIAEYEKKIADLKKEYSGKIAYVEANKKNELQSLENQFNEELVNLRSAHSDEYIYLRLGDIVNELGINFEVTIECTENKIINYNNIYRYFSKNGGNIGLTITFYHSLGNIYIDIIQNVFEKMPNGLSLLDCMSTRIIKGNEEESDKTYFVITDVDKIMNIKIPIFLVSLFDKDYAESYTNVYFEQKYAYLQGPYERYQKAILNCLEDRARQR